MNVDNTWLKHGLPTAGMSGLADKFVANLSTFLAKEGLTAHSFAYKGELVESYPKFIQMLASKFSMHLLHSNVITKDFMLVSGLGFIHVFNASAQNLCIVNGIFLNDKKRTKNALRNQKE